MTKSSLNLPGRAALFTGLVVLSACGSPPAAHDAGYTQYYPTGPGGGGNGNGSGGQNGDGGTDAGTTEVGAAADLRVDTNRDGVVSLTDFTDEGGEDTWTPDRGAVFLANIDDDLRSCPTRDSANQPLSDALLAACNDAADSVINGPDDLIDLARIRVVAWPAAPADAAAALTVGSAESSKVRLFKGSGTNFTVFDAATDRLTAADLRDGVEFAIEAKDIVRDTAVWDGSVTVTLEVISTEANLYASDSVMLRVSPVMLFHHLSPAETVYATNIVGDADSAAFRSAMQTSLTASGVSRPLTAIAANDQWTQDFFETGYMSMPGANGEQHVIRVAFRSSNIWESRTSKYPLRPAGRYVFTQLRGPDSAGLQQVDLNWDLSGSMDTLNSFGNTETLPPYTHDGVSYPMGRVLRGSVPTFQPDPSFAKMLEAQKVQPVVTVDTSWLLVAHIDETVSFVPAATPRGWKMLVNDPALARQMLQAEATAGNGAVQMFVGKYWDVGRPAAASINAVLNDPDVMAESAAAAAEVDAQVQIIKAATGLTDAELIAVPFLHYPAGGGSLAFQPGTVNGVVLNPGHYISPDPFGPVINGKDIFKVQLQAALDTVGMTVHFVDDWDLYHALAGEVHCASNAARVIPSTKWWESGR